MIRLRRPCLRLALAGFALLAACGKKGPPLAPLRPVPAQVTDLSARRVGADVHLQFTIPARNEDGSVPADLAQLDIYGLTAEREAVTPPLTDQEFLEYATRVASVEVPPSSGGEETTAASADRRPGQGETVTVRETLGVSERTPATLSGLRKGARRDGLEMSRVVTPPLVWPSPEPRVQRTYAVVGVSARGRRGALSRRVPAALVEGLSHPPEPAVRHNETAVLIEWQTPEGARRRIQAPAGAGILPARPLIEWSEPTRYNVYEVVKENGPALPVPLNPAPLEAGPYEDPRVEFGVKRCYVVRALDTIAGFQVESLPSPAACLVLRDVFPPAPPNGLSAVASAGLISLIWEANTESDLAGYLVLRGEAAGEKLQPLMSAPIRETTYQDAAARPGVRYAYAVVAVDTATPANVSAPSSRVEETARE